MFDPKLADVRRFFCGIWRKHRDRMPLEPLEALALDWILKHPEYHRSLENPDAAVAADYSPQAGKTNPFLHLSLHLAVSEQLSIDQPPGIRALVQALERKLGSAHDAAHQAQECLAQTLWRAQRDSQPPDQQAYLDCLSRRAGLPPSAG
ncbi:MAG: DUF1841 family protein [Lautropia sp.]|nr:DUF1841 family protein [Lautropia sp.]